LDNDRDLINLNGIIHKKIIYWDEHKSNLKHYLLYSIPAPYIDKQVCHGKMNLMEKFGFVEDILDFVITREKVIKFYPELVNQQQMKIPCFY